mmetsp:Transcript_22600/g.62742  ORF Transcript_22600/g.62742 Transcript_22600/m.62742 type:complete len:90 (+) Transcript_22600:479-748(+)
MAGLMGIRAPLGVNVGSNGVVGTSAAAGTMPSSTQQVKQKGKVIHGSPKDSGNLLFMTAGHNKVCLVPTATSAQPRHSQLTLLAVHKRY